MHFTIMGLTRSRDEFYEVQVHFQWAQYIWTTFLRGFLVTGNLVPLLDIH